MSTTSLSSCDNCDYYPYNDVLEDSYNTYMQSYQGPFYNTMGRPLVYYAQLQPCCKRSSKGRRKDKNVFARAFNWYTQEREPCPPQRMPELGGFAMWLDAKYVEYLRESECKQPCGPLKPAWESSTNDIVPCHINEPSSTKRHSRMKSPWRKFRGQNKNAGDVPCKTPNESCQFILQPKDLTRPTSECNYQTTNCPNKSNITVISTEIDGTKKTLVKSQSMTSIFHDNIITACIDLNNTQEGPKNRQVDAQKCRVVEKAPQVTPKSHSPCDQSCKIKQEGKTGDTIQISCAKVQKADIPDDCGKPGCKPVEQNIGVLCAPDCCKPKEQKLPAKTQIDDPNCCKHECKPTGEIRVSVQAQKSEMPNNSNCRKPAGETSNKQQKIEINYDPNCCNQETKPTGEIRIASNSQNVDIVYNSICCRQKCKPAEDIQQDITKSQIKDILCKPSCIAKQNIETSCYPNCTNKLESKAVCETQPAPITPEPYYCRQENKPMAETKTVEITCNPNCLFKQGHKPVASSKSRRSEESCMWYLPKSTSEINKIDCECQCSEDALPIDAQVQLECSCQKCVSTSTNNTLCKCIFESPVQAPPCKPIQTCPKTPQQLKTSEDACQCPENDITKLDTPSQYERRPMDKSYECLCSSQDKRVKARQICNMPDKKPKTFRNDDTQTSDHSICIEDVGHDYAFFVKIFCSAKLYDCSCDSLTR